MTFATIVVSALVGTITSAITAYFTTQFRMREDRAKWEREFALKYAVARAEDEAAGASLAKQFAVGYLIVEHSGKEKKKKEKDKVFLPRSSRLTIGRAADNDVVIDDDCASFRHAMVQVEGTLVVLIDLGATNRTEVNGAPVDGRRQLASGDLILIGDTKITFREL